MAMTITPDHDTEFEQSGRRRKITKFALAGVAVLGVGAALTSAAWTDDVFFGGSASSGGIELEGSTDNVNFFVGDASDNVDLVIEEFVIGPDSSDSKRVWVQNTGDLEIRLSTVTATGSGPLFTNGATVVAVSSDADGLLGPNQKARIDVTVTGNPAWTGDTMQDQAAADNSIVVNVQGSTDLVAP